MRPLLLVLYIGLSCLSSQLFAEQVASEREQYIALWKDVAIAQMQSHGIPASITLAQAILESGNGKSMLSVEANNHFGIKCHGWDGPGVYKDDDKKNECFRKYRNASESFEDHAQFLKKKRYEFLYDYKVTDYKSWAKGLRKAGYATDPSYARRLIDLIEAHDLDQYDRGRQSLARNTGKESSRPRFSSERSISDDDLAVINVRMSREVQMHPNKIKFVRAKSGDSVERLADDLELSSWQIKRYNGVDDGHRFEAGDMVFIQPKKNKSSTPYHLALSGESLEQISQRYGVKLKKLKSYNPNLGGKKLKTGTKVKLRK